MTSFLDSFIKDHGVNPSPALNKDDLLYNQLLKHYEDEFMRYLDGKIDKLADDLKVLMPVAHRMKILINYDTSNIDDETTADRLYEVFKELSDEMSFDDCLSYPED
jgi:hypothetical protein